MDSKEYYYLNGDVKVGPMSLDAIKGAPITPDTLVWNSSLPDWVEARTLSELQEVFVSKNQTIPTPTPTFSQPNQTSFSPNMNRGFSVEPKPDDYLVWAILATLFCCLPLGIVSIINATKVNSAYNMGDYVGAKKASDDAKKWAIWAAVGGVIGITLYVVVVVFGAMAGALS